MIARICIVFLLLADTLLCPASAQTNHAPVPVKLWTYYNFSPFLNPVSHSGLVVDLADLLTQMSDGKYHFMVEYLPRKRIDLQLKTDQLGAVALVNPQWFPNNLSVSRPLLVGLDYVISPVAAFNPANDVKPKQFLGVVGHQYPALAYMVRHQTIVRQNVSSIDSLFKLIAKKRGDFAIVPGLVAIHHKATDEYSSQIVFSPQTHNTYSRALIFNEQHVELGRIINGIIESKEGIKSWQKLLIKYQVESLALK